jgi:NADPH2:quinone reductase
MSDIRLVVRQFGGPELIEAEPLVGGPVAPGRVRVRHRAIGVNFIDIYHRNGLYQHPLPSPLGVEAAGVVEALGDGVTGFGVGERVGYISVAPGGYASWADIAADRLIRLPDTIDDRTAAAALLKGLTVQTLIAGCARAQAGQSALVLAAAGGVGRMLVQWLSAIGVRVIAHAGSAEKAAIAGALGATRALHCRFETLAAEARAANGGEGVDIVFDGVGAASWTASLDSLRPRGMMISFGNASGPVPPTSPLELARRGSLFLTRPRVYDYTDTRAELDAAATALFGMIESRRLDIAIGLVAPLSEAAEAHRALEARQTSGSIVLLP